jgi:bifunctional DNA-binding transcriptional regulator/antitoxin component of YhaV-PrlF toxin-antitoxin module
MRTTYTTTVIGDGNHASIHVPDEVLAELGANRRAPLRVTIGGHAYRSTATAVNGECRVVFPQADRDAAGAKAGDIVMVELELETGHREVELPAELEAALTAAGLRDVFEALTYSKRREFARQVAEAKAAETKAKRVEKVLAALA